MLWSEPFPLTVCCLLSIIFAVVWNGFPPIGPAQIGTGSLYMWFGVGYNSHFVGCTVFGGHCGIFSVGRGTAWKRGQGVQGAFHVIYRTCGLNV
jgi:hypothetical protein